MSGVILATASTDLARRVRVANDDQLTVIRPEQLPVGPAQLLALAEVPESIAAVAIDVGGERELEGEALELASRFEQQYPAVGVLLFSEQAESLALRALRSGVRDVLDVSAEIPDIRWAIRRASDLTHVSGKDGTPVTPDTYTGRVITVASPKGGVGKTTLATNVARALAEQSPRGTALVDLDVQFGDVAAALDLDPDYTVGEILDGPALRDAMALKSLMATHRSGLQVVCGVKSPAEADKLAADKVSHLLDTLRQEFRYVVLDTAPGLSEHTLAALDHTTDLVLVTSLDVPGVRGLRKELEVLDQLSLHPHTRHIVVNNADRISGISVADVEATIGRKVDLVVPRHASILRSTNVGSPVVELAPKEKVSKELAKFASRFSPTGSHGERTRWRRGQG